MLFHTPIVILLSQQIGHWSHRWMCVPHTVLHSCDWMTNEIAVRPVSGRCWWWILSPQVAI